MSPLRILLLEDNSVDAELIQELLEADHFVCEVARVQTRAEFLAGLEDPGIDLILADYKLPSFDGLSALKLALSARPDLPFIFVSGTLGEEVAIEALKIGATDYILKTRLSRLVPSVRRALREARERAERKRAEETLREQANLLSLTHDAISVCDMSGIIRYWNRGAEGLYGWTAGHAVGKVIHNLLKTIFPKPRTEIEEELVHAGRWEGELGHTRKDGSQLVVASRWSLQRDEKGAPVAVLVTNNDITERKGTEQALQVQANLLEQTHDAVLVWELPGTIIYWNRGAEQLYGFSKQEAIGRRSHDLLRTEHPIATELFEPLVESQGAWAGELTHMTREGRKIVVESRHVLMRGADGRRLVLETNRDITTRKRAEEALQRSEAYLAEAQRLTHTGNWAFRAGLQRAAYWSEENFRIWASIRNRGPRTAKP